jgi:hypothetical protein
MLSKGPIKMQSQTHWMNFKGLLILVSLKNGLKSVSSPKDFSLVKGNRKSLSSQAKVNGKWKNK